MVNAIVDHLKIHHNKKTTQPDTTAPRIKESLFFLRFIFDIKLFITGKRSEVFVKEMAFD